MDQQQEDALAEAGRLLGEALAQGPQEAPGREAPPKPQIGNAMLGPVTIHTLTQHFS